MPTHVDPEGACTQPPTPHPPQSQGNPALSMQEFLEQLLRPSGRAPKVDLSKLLESGYLFRGQSVRLVDHSRRLVGEVYARVYPDGLEYEGHRYSMSALAEKLLPEHGYHATKMRGPKHWATRHGRTLLDLWESYRNRQRDARRDRLSATDEAKYHEYLMALGRQPSAELIAAAAQRVERNRALAEAAFTYGERKYPCSSASPEQVLALCYALASLETALEKTEPAARWRTGSDLDACFRPHPTPIPDMLERLPSRLRDARHRFEAWALRYCTNPCVPYGHDSSARRLARNPTEYRMLLRAEQETASWRLEANQRQIRAARARREAKAAMRQVRHAEMQERQIARRIERAHLIESLSSQPVEERFRHMLQTQDYPPYAYPSHWADELTDDRLTHLDERQLRALRDALHSPPRGPWRRLSRRLTWIAPTLPG